MFTTTVYNLELVLCTLIGHVPALLFTSFMSVPRLFVSESEERASQLVVAVVYGVVAMPTWVFVVSKML